MRRVFFIHSAFLGTLPFAIGQGFPRCSVNEVCSEVDVLETIVTRTVGGLPVTETFVPTTYTQLASLTAAVTTTLFDATSKPLTVVAGPSGVAWAPLDSNPGPASLSPPTSLPEPISDQNPTATLRPGGTLVVATIGSLVITETFVPATLSNYASLTSTLTTTTTDSGGSHFTLLIGPGGIGWTPLNPSSGSLQAPAPTELPVGTKSLNSLLSVGPASTQNSITDLFANTALPTTVLTFGSTTKTWVRDTFTDLATITKITTVTTPVAQTNKDGSLFTVSAAIIVVGPGGIWWNGGTGGFGLSGPGCIWPLCPPGSSGGGDIGGGGSGHSPHDPNTPGSNENPEPPNGGGDNLGGNSGPPENEGPDPSGSDSVSMKSSTSMSTSASKSTSSCSATRTVSDCSNICSAPTSGTTTLSQTCSMTCYSTVTGCSVTGTTVTSTLSASACTSNVMGWTNVVDGTDFDYSTIIFSVPQPTKSWGISCMPDGAPWAFPTSWCDCGPLLTYPTLPASPDATSANCAYTTFASSTIVPSTTSAPPTNVPGLNGVPACAVVVSARGTAAYCNCGGTPAPLIGSTSSGSLDCDYTIQPTSSFSPTVSSTLQTSTISTLSHSGPTSAPGICHANVEELMYIDVGPSNHDQGRFEVSLTDDSGNSIGHHAEFWQSGTAINIDSQLPQVLLLTGQQSGGYNTVPTDKVHFAYGKQSWTSDSSQCSVREYSHWDYTPDWSRTIDCTFDCSSQGSKRSNTLSSGNLWNLGPRTSRSDLWNSHAQKGQGYYDTWSRKHGLDATSPCNYDTAFRVKDIQKVSPNPDIKDVLRPAGYAGKKTYWKHDATFNENQNARFRNTISPSEQVFLALDNNRGYDLDENYHPTGATSPLAWQFSTVAWLQWKSTVEHVAKLKSPNVDLSQVDLSGMKAFFRILIENPETNKLLEEAITGDDDVYATKTWTPQNRDLSNNPFWALLGSPNGRGVQFMLTENKVAMKGKGIASISAVKEPIFKKWTMWATLTE